MNPKVQEILDKKILDKREQELQRRKEHLITLGFVDKNKFEKFYCSAFDENTIKEEDTNRYYVYKYDALDLTDEEYEEICKHFPEPSTQQINNNYKEPIQAKYETPIAKDYKGELMLLIENISSIQFWVKLWSILSIISAAIVIFIMFIAPLFD